METLLLLVAQGFGLGRIPVGPGTFGSLGGLLWLMLLAATGNFWLYLAGTSAGLGLSVWLCGEAERILKQPDPPSVVLDELTAMPVCFVGWFAAEWFRHGVLPSPERLFSGRVALATGVLFVLFRVFDVLKPWFIGASQRLPGGWGITADDFLAAALVALFSLVGFA